MISDANRETEFAYDRHACRNTQQNWRSIGDRMNLWSGLALVRQIARAHGGEARCRPRDGGGTVFEVDLDA